MAKKKLDPERAAFIKALSEDEDYYNYVVDVIAAFDEAQEQEPMTPEDFVEDEGDCPFKQRAAKSALFWG